MNKYFLLAASALALASCSSDDFLGENPENGQNAANSVINFGGETGKTTRAANGTSVGAAAADLLGNTFYVLGTKGTLPDNNPTETIVFDNYKVVWEGNTAGTTADNTNDWRYVGVPKTGLYAGSEISEQTIKYWDYSQPQYDFIAYSVGKNILLTTGAADDGKIVGTAIKTPKATDYLSYSLTGKKIDDLKKCYYTDVTTVEKDGTKANYSKPVTFTFKNLTAKVRVAFYETIPGYTVNNIQFYDNGNDARAELTGKDAAVLFTTGADQYLSTSGTINVTYPKVGNANKSDKAYNKAFVSVTTGTDERTTKLGLGNVIYNEQGFLNDNAKQANMAGTAGDNYFTPVLPAAGHALTLRLNYTLTSTDGSGETINVYGATAVVPASYTAWQPNYAYTYIFKISDNTNGATSTATGTPEGLFPITFDAVVADVDNVDFNHESITTVSTPSVTSYAYDTHDKKVILARGVGNEYPASANTEIYFSVYDKGETKTDLNDKGQLYTVTKNDATGNPVVNFKVTEAEVIDALQIRTSDNTATTITGRNGIVLTPATTYTNITTIPTDDGKTVPVTANTTAKFTANATPTTYAYVYLNEDGTESAIYTAVTFAAGSAPTAQANEYYLDPSGTTVVTAGTTLEANKTYYKKYKNNNNVYGVKVVKTYTE